MFATRHSDLVSEFGRVVLVASLGGLEAFTTVLAGLPVSFPIPIVVVQHRARTSNGHDGLAACLTRRIDLPVHVAESGADANQPGVTVVPGATTATLDPVGRWVLAEATHQVGVGDVLLASSAAEVPTIAVILTGYLADGSEGCRAVKSQGGRVLVQDPATARAASMPANAIATGCVDFVLPLNRLATALLALTVAPGVADLLTVSLPPWARLTPNTSTGSKPRTANALSSMRPNGNNAATVGSRAGAES
jgi:two-component system chemotaxis response regulator CheB